MKDQRPARGIIIHFLAGIFCPEYVTAGVYDVCFITAVGKIFYNRFLHCVMGQSLLLLNGNNFSNLKGVYPC